jgi:glycerol-3-phosphate dehydrogenase
MNFVVVGAGAWGTAFALHLARTGHSVALVPRRPEQAQAIASHRENPEYLPGVSLPPALVVTPDLAAAVAGPTLSCWPVRPRRCAKPAPEFGSPCRRRDRSVWW